jgi:hypothetical protein
MSLRRVAPVAAMLLVALLALAACSAGQSTATATATAATRSPVVSPAPTVVQGIPPTPAGSALGPAPTNCPAMPPPQTFTMASGFGGGFSDPVSFTGSSPVWELGLSSPLQAGQFGGPDNPYPSYKVMWIVGPNVTQPVTLIGHELQSGAPLWFEIYPSIAAPITAQTRSVYTMQAVLDPAAPNRGGTTNSKGRWGIWGIGIIPLAAGCYDLEVAWTGGHWHTMFAAGR